MKTGKKIQKKFDARMRGWLAAKAAAVKDRPNSERGWAKPPGSRNLRKS